MSKSCVLAFAFLMAASSASLAAECNKRAVAACAACHTFNPGEPVKIGPRLAGVIGRKVGSDSAFTNYSPGFKAAQAKGEVWTKDKIDAFLKDPKAMYPDNTMAAAPVRDAKQRADILCVLENPG